MIQTSVVIIHVRKNDVMAQLIPSDLDLKELASEAEQRVLQSLLLGLDDSWVLVPSVRVKHRGNDHEIDILAASPTRGVVVFEVKGGLITVVDGLWHQNGHRCQPQPDDQILESKHALVKRLQKMKINLHDLFIDEAIGLPDVHEVPEEGLGTRIPRERILDGTMLPYPAELIHAIHREHDPVPTERFHAFLNALKPTVSLGGREGRASPAALKMLDEQAEERLAMLRQLGGMSRVIVTGGPGTGKSWLVVDWAKQAIERGDRTAVICFNRPIADQLAGRLPTSGIIASTYHGLITDYLMAHRVKHADEGEAVAEDDGTLVIRPQQGQEFWDHKPTDFLLRHLDEVEEKFDTLIIDEAQDMRPHWFDSLEALLEPSGRILMTADLEQMIYVDRDEWKRPPDAVEWTLDRNLRSAKNIAKVLQHLGGPAPLPDAPKGMKVRHLLAGGNREVVKRVRKRIDELVTEFGVPHSEILVLTLRREQRDAIVESSDDELAFTTWEERDEGSVVCETAHRTKGLEATAVILVTTEDEPTQRLAYVGASRAIWSLTLIGPRAFAEMFGIEPMATESTGESQKGRPYGQHDGTL